jgi:hypothetical protein
MAIRKLLLPLQTAATAEAAFSTAAIVSQMWCPHLAVLHVTADRSIPAEGDRGLSPNPAAVPMLSPNRCYAVN